MAGIMMHLTVSTHSRWLIWRSDLHDRAHPNREHGGVPSDTAMIFLLVVAAIAAGTVIAAKIQGNVERIPSP